jgi:hypothetical protein
VAVCASTAADIRHNTTMLEMDLNILLLLGSRAVRKYGYNAYILFLIYSIKSNTYNYAILAGQTVYYKLCGT